MTRQKSRNRLPVGENFKRFRLDDAGADDNVRLRHRMSEIRLQITRGTFLNHVRSQELAGVESSLGYAPHHKQGQTMSQDKGIKYFKSKWADRPCTFFEHVTIEGDIQTFIFF